MPEGHRAFFLIRGDRKTFDEKETMQIMTVSIKTRVSPEDMYDDGRHRQPASGSRSLQSDGFQQHYGGHTSRGSLKNLSEKKVAIN